MNDNILREHEDTYIYPVSKFNHAAKITKEQYKKLYEESIRNPDIFWAKQAERLHWFKKWEKVKETDFNNDINIKWFEGGKLNISHNCIDRHLPARANQTAIIWESDNPEISKNITYSELHLEVCKFANVLKNLGVKKGDVVTIYLPMIPEAAYAMLACTRIGAIHSVVFGGFSSESLRNRIIDCNSKLIITSDESIRGGRKFPLKKNSDEAIAGLNNIKTIVVQHTGDEIELGENDYWYHDERSKASDYCEAEHMESEDPLFILYTSGSTGKPKGVMHTSAGYLLYSAFTHEVVFDYQEGDIYWCTADVGWVTGHSYIIYGPLANGATTLMFEGVPTYPDASRFWQVIDKHKVTQFYTAPTAIRALMGQGDEFVNKTVRSSLRILGSVGEPINPEAWLWYYNIVGEGRCPIVDTWWQTETGGHLITPIPYATDLKPGSATLPFFGIKPEILEPTTGKVLEGEAEGVLVIADSWPGQMRSVYKDHKRFKETYFSQYAGKYFTGDGCRRDKDGYYWITGRVDDVINVSGHRLGTAEIESALVGHNSVAESAVVGYPHEIKGQGIYAYVWLKSGIKASDEIKNELLKQVQTQIGAIARPDKLQFVPGLPKTRSGKIMRRILRKVAEDKINELGDISTLLNPEVVEAIVSSRVK